MKTLTTYFLILLTSLTYAQNNALNFGGTNEYVSISSLFGFDGYSESVEAWVNLSSTSEQGLFVHIGNNDTGYGIGVGNGIDADNPGNELVVLIDLKRWVTTATNIGTGWHHVAMTIDASGNVIIYLDGVAVKTETGNTDVPITPSSASSIGSAPGGIRVLSSGIIDDVRIWNDVRTPTEINNNMSIEIADPSSEANLVANYKLNETSGSTADNAEKTASFDGTLNNMLDANWVAAQNNALNFGGTNEYASISSVFSLDGLSESVELWVNLSTTSESGFFTHFGDNDVGYGIAVGSGTTDNLGNELLILYDLKRWIATGASIGTGWHHIAITIDASGNCAVYLDGVSVYTESANQAPLAPSGGSSLGSVPGGTRVLSSGIIDEVRIWNDVRTSTEINDNMRKEFSDISTETNLVSYYKLNETSGATAYDSKGSNNGTLNNMLDANWVTSTAFDVVVNTYYMAKTTGNWNAFGTVWFTNTTGGTTAGDYTTQATEAPTATNSAGIIINADVTVDANVTINQCTVNSGTTLTVGSGVVLTVSDDTGTDLTITGAIVNNGIVTISSGTLVNYNGGSQTILALTYSSLSFTGSTSSSTKTFADGTTKINSEIALTDAITVTGSGVNAVTVQVTTPGAGGTNSRVFNVNATGKTVNISHITIKGGDIDGAPTTATYGGGIFIAAGTLNLDNAKVDGSKACYGGGVQNSATTNITNSTISNNTIGSSRLGGGIMNYNNSTMSITNSTISNNSGDKGGGILNYASLTITNSTISNNSGRDGAGLKSNNSLTVTNSTISNNVASGEGGGVNCAGSFSIENSTIFNNSSVYNGAGIYTTGTSTILNTTISKNNVTGANQYGGGIYIKSGTANIKNTIIAENTSTALTNDDYYCYYDSFMEEGGTLTDNGYNVVGYQAGDQTGTGKTFTATTNILYNTKADGTTGYTSWNSNNVDLANQNLNLSTTLADNSTVNGTQTLALSSGSFAIDAGTDTGAPSTDQRGMARSGTADIGAYEYVAPTPVELVSFTYELQQSPENDISVLLKWETATEINNYGFELERASIRSKERNYSATDEWETIGFVEGHGNSYSPKYYEFVDENMLADSAEYRLKQIDTDGAYTYYAQTVKVSGYGVTDVKDRVIPNEYALEQNYPNPFNPSTTIKYSIPVDTRRGVSPHVTIKVYNIIGQEVATLVNKVQQPGNYSVNFDASDLASGTYIYRITSGKFVSTKKLLLIK